MKIGILTFINTINYGALFQAFALQWVLEKLGHRAEVLQYTNIDIEKKEMNANKLSPKYLLRKIVIGNKFVEKRKKFQLYEQAKIHKGAAIQRCCFDNSVENYDAVVVGSDQVWNVDLTYGDYTYFLEGFENLNKRVAYAPSFGNHLNEEKLNDKVVQLLNKFCLLSVREQSGANLINRVMNKDVKVVLDPTLLLNKNEWSKYFSFTPPQYKYILVYFPNNKKKVFGFAKKLAKATGCKIVYLSISPRVQMGVETIYDASPEEWLGWLYYADYVIVGSFHGTAFSINFGKQFFYENAGEGSRIDNLVSVTGTKYRDLDCCDIEEKIDYSKVHETLDALRDDSIAWLKSGLEK